MKRIYFALCIVSFSLILATVFLFAKYEIVNGGRSSNNDDLYPGEVFVSYLTGNKMIHTTSNKTIVIVDSTTPKIPMLIFPLNAKSYSRMITFCWEKVVDDTEITYILEISTTIDFSVIKTSLTTQSTFYQVEFDNKAEYYWRVGCYDIVKNFSGFATGQFVLDLGIYISKNKKQEIKLPHFRISIPQNAISENVQLYFSSDPVNNPIFVNPEIINQANQKLEKDKVLLKTTLTEIVLRDIYGEKFISNFASDVGIDLYFKDNNNDNFVDDYPNVHVKSLKVCVLDENNKTWIELPSEVDTIDKVVKSKINHFSVFVLVGQQKVPKNLDKVYVYPNPYKSSYGINYVVFRNLTPTAKIKIFNIAGELVESFENKGNDTEEKWYLPKNLASGVYIYLITDNQGNNKIDRFVIMK